jgi:hypothetical protein
VCTITVAAVGDVWVALVSTRTLAVMPKVNKLIRRKGTITIRNSGIVVTKAVFTAA